MRLDDGREITLADVEAVTLELEGGGSVRLAGEDLEDVLGPLVAEAFDLFAGETLDWSCRLMAENEPADRPVVLIGEPREHLDGMW